MTDILIVTGSAAPFDPSPSAVAASGLGRALAAAGHTVTLITVASEGRAQVVPGLARRLRPLDTTVAGQSQSITIYEGPAPASRARLFVAAATAATQADTAALLGGAVDALARAGTLAPDVLVGWGEAAAMALSATAAGYRIFALPDGTVSEPLSPPELAALGAVSYGDDVASRSLAGLGAAAANVLLAPSPGAAARLGREPALTARAADEPVVAIRLGCDDPPHDPTSDTALAAPYGADALAGKSECRRTLARRASLSLGPRTLILATGPLEVGAHGEEILSALADLPSHDVVVAVADGGDRALTERARVLAIEHPGRIAVVTDTDVVQRRQTWSGADALLLGSNDGSGRAAGLALRYGTLPLAPDEGTASDFLIDLDPASATGTAILYPPRDAFGLRGAVQRAIAARHDADVWPVIVRGLLSAAPTWIATAAALEGMWTAPSSASTT